MGLGVAQALTAPGLDVNWAVMQCTFSSSLPTVGAFRAVGAHCFPSVAPNCGYWLSALYVHHDLRAVSIGFLCAPYSLCCEYWVLALHAVGALV